MAGSATGDVAHKGADADGYRDGRADVYGNSCRSVDAYADADCDLSHRADAVVDFNGRAHADGHPDR